MNKRGKQKKHFNTYKHGPGNTKVGPSNTSAHHSWFFTWNNYTEENLKTLNTLLLKKCKKFIFQEETGKNGTPHLQGCFNLKQAINFWGVVELIGSRKLHIEVIINWRKACKYCCKAETRTGRIFNYRVDIDGEPPELTMEQLERWRYNQFMDMDLKIIEPGLG